MRRKTAESIRIQNLRKSTGKIIFKRISRKGPLRNVVRKLHAKFNRGSFIRKLSKIGELCLEGERKKKQGILNTFRLKFKVP